MNSLYLTKTQSSRCIFLPWLCSQIPNLGRKRRWKPECLCYIFILDSMSNQELDSIFTRMNIYTVQPALHIVSLHHKEHTLHSIKNIYTLQRLPMGLNNLWKQEDCLWCAKKVIFSSMVNFMCYSHTFSFSLSPNIFPARSSSQNSGFNLFIFHMQF